MARKYALDTNLFIYGLRDAAVADRLAQFHEAHAPFEYLSSVVEQELLAGARTTGDAEALRRHLFGRFERIGRVVTPTPMAWRRAGLVLAAIARTEQVAVASMSKSFANDVLLALSCREAGVTLVTANERDFKRIKRYITGFQFLTELP